MEKLNLNGQGNQPILVNDHIFKNQLKNGFFFEAGAFDGEKISNTLFFELKHNWTGLLVEGHPDAFETLKGKVRINELFDQRFYL